MAWRDLLREFGDAEPTKGGAWPISPGAYP